MQAPNGMNGIHQIEDHVRTENATLASHPTPLFERLVTEEVQELKSCLRMIDNQQRRIHEQEKVHGDLESRLQQEARERLQLVTTLEEREREWASKFKLLEEDRDRWKRQKEQEESKTKRLMEQLNRKGQEIHRMLQRKYDKNGDATNSNNSMRNVRQSTSERAGGPSHPSSDRSSNNRAVVGTEQQFESPHEILSASGTMETVQIRNVQTLLAEFFVL